MIVTNHTYDVIGLMFLLKRWVVVVVLSMLPVHRISQQEKREDGTEIVGNIIKAKTAKSRLSKENKTVEIRLYYDDRGLDRYYGLLELGEIGGLWKNVAGRYEINGKKVYAKEVYKNPEKYFNAEVMQALDETAQKEFSYGGLNMKDRVERTILSNLLHNEDYLRKVIPFIKADYFEEKKERNHL